MQTSHQVLDWKTKNKLNRKTMSKWFKSQDYAHVLNDIPGLVNHNFIQQLINKEYNSVWIKRLRDKIFQKQLRC